MISLTTSTTCLALGGTLPLQRPHTTILAALYHSLFIFIALALPIVAMILLHQNLLHLLYCPALLCVLCTSTLWAQNSICSLLTSLASFNVVKSLMIPSTTFSSSKLFMNCSFSLLSCSTYLQSVALTHYLPIIPWWTHVFFF